MPKVAVVLSGCGVYDGSEIHESVITLLALNRAGAEVQCFAPDINQMHVVNHLKGEVEIGESRNVLVESARIARGNVKDLSTAKATDFDAVIFPGGFGVAKNLCDFAVKGSDCFINPEVEELILDGFNANIPMGFICIAPVIASKVLGAKNVNVKVTIGTDPETAKEIVKMGAKHINCAVNDCVIDRKNKIVTTPAYMLANHISEAAAGIDKLVKEVLALTRK
ncbi:MAG: isoprenoid biosynthesis protein ElbB [Candidatus Neomarinimicrobiota bacterium]|nr:MAG: isoprenoid biosynthesis protein ElbB [Candidatus Neomarinimicrobiota bacterium]